MKRRRAPKPVDPEQQLSLAGLDAAALAYLDRFDASETQLRRVLFRRIARVREADPELIQVARDRVRQLLERYRASGLINDGRFAENMAASLRRRGTSRRAVAEKLRLRGIASDVVEQALARADEDSESPELDAAKAYARRRRLGPHRAEEERAARARRDLAAMARAGFSFDVARRALEWDGEVESS